VIQALAFPFAIRNGKPGDSMARKPYAEKIMTAEDGQITPMHFHRSKMAISSTGGKLNIGSQRHTRTGWIPSAMYTFPWMEYSERLKPGSLSN
jgi:D-lyxose ketol-isomerase